MRKKLFAILMSAMMMVTFMPAMAFAGVVKPTDAPDLSTFEYEHTRNEVTKTETVVAGTCKSAKVEKKIYKNGDFDVDVENGNHKYVTKEMSFDEATAVAEVQISNWLYDFARDLIGKEEMEEKIINLLLGFGPADEGRIKELRGVLDTLGDIWSTDSNVFQKALQTVNAHVYSYFADLKDKGHAYVDSTKLGSKIEETNHYCYFRVNICENCNDVKSVIGFNHEAPADLAPCAISYACTKCGKTVYQENHVMTDLDTIVKNLVSLRSETKLSTFFNQLFFFDAKEKKHDLTTTTEATACGEVKTVTCSKCGLSYSYTIPTTALKHSYEWVTLVEPNCGEADRADRTGLKVKKCTVCGAIDMLSFKEVEPKHNFVDTTFEPTCTLPGYTVKACDKCGAIAAVTSNSFTAPAGHDYDIQMVIEPQCGSNGLLKIECKRCNRVRFYTDLDEAATVTVSNLAKFLATAKNYPESGIVKVEDELHATSKYYFIGYDYDLVKAPIELTNPAGGAHKFTTWGITAEPTCEEGTAWAPKCSKCGVVATVAQATRRGQNFVFYDEDALGHDWKEYALTETCEHKAGTLKVCQRCGEEEYYDADGFAVENTRRSPFWKGGHCVSDNTWTTVEDSTFTKVGMRATHCMKCGGIVVREDIGVKKLAKAYQPTLKGGKKSITLKFKNIGKAATGVQVAYKVAGANNYKYVKTTFKNSKTIKGLKSGKKYTVKVRKYVVEDGQTIYGKWCAVKYVKTK